MSVWRRGGAAGGLGARRRDCRVRVSSGAWTGVVRPAGKPPPRPRHPAGMRVGRPAPAADRPATGKSSTCRAARFSPCRSGAGKPDDARPWLAVRRGLPGYDTRTTARAAADGQHAAACGRKGTRGCGQDSRRTIYTRKQMCLASARPSISVPLTLVAM